MKYSPPKKVRHLPLLQRFGKNVRQEREQQNLTQEKLAEISNLDIRTIQRIENCEINPSLDVVISLIHGLNVSPEKLLNFLLEE